jgi:hypothetical protein
MTYTDMGDVSYMSDPFWKTNGKDDFTKFFGSDSNAMLELKLSAPPDRPTLHEKLLMSQTAKSKDSGEDFLVPDEASDWWYGGFYRVNKAISAIYPRFNPKDKHRDSNFTMPVNHVRTVLYISKQADTEIGEDTTLALKGWTESNPEVPWYLVNSRKASFHNFKAAPNNGIVKVYNVHKKRRVADFIDQTNHPSVLQYGGAYFAKRLGFEVKCHAFPKCVEEFDAFNTDKMMDPSQFGPAGGGGDYQACIGVKWGNPQMPQWDNSTWARNVYSNKNLLEDHTYQNKSLNISHESVGSSPYFWLPQKHWRDVLKQQDLEHFPFADPRDSKGIPVKTRPVNYRFWDTVYTTGVYGGPTFTCISTEAAPNVGGTLPDIQHYRDAMMAFNADESHLMQFHDENYGTPGTPMTDIEIQNAIDPGNYGPMPSSSTRKDVTYDMDNKGRYIEHSPSMAKRRQVHYRQMVHANTNATQDYRNTFCVAPHNVNLKELSHHPQNDVTKNKFADGVFANQEEYLRLMRVEDNLGASNLFHVQVSTGSVDDETAAVTQSLVNMGLNHLKSKLESARADAIKVLIAKAREYIAPLTKKLLEAILMQIQTKIKPEFVDSFLKFVTKAKEGGNFVRAEAVNEFNQTLVDGNFGQIKDNILDRIKTLLKDKIVGIKDSDIKSPEVPKGAKSDGSLRGITVGDDPGDIELAEKIQNAQTEPDYSRFYEDSLDTSGEAIDEGVDMSVKAAVPEFEVGAEVAANVAKAATPLLETVAEGMSALGPELLPIAAMTGVLMGIDALLAQAKEKEAAERAKEAAKKQEEIDKANVKKYYNEMIGVSLGQSHSTAMRTFLKSKLLGDGYTNFALPYRVLLEKIINNELCVDMVDTQWLHDNKDNAKGKNILTAEMIRSMHVVDYYLRNSTNMMPQSSSPLGGTFTGWAGTFRPFPPRADDPATFQKDTMTPLPVINKRIRAKLDTLEGDAYYYGPWIPSVITTVEPANTLSLDVGAKGSTDIKMNSFKRHVIPVPVFVGFAASPTGFVSSEQPNIAWPTVANKKHGGYIHISALTTRPNTLSANFKDGMDYYKWRNANTKAKLLSTPRTGLGLSLAVDEPASRMDGTPDISICAKVCNKTNRDIAVVLFSTTSPEADLKKATKKALQFRYLGCYKDFDYDVANQLAGQYTTTIRAIGDSTGKATVLAAPTHLGCFKDDGWDAFFHNGTQTGSGRALPQGGVSNTYRTVAEAFAAAKARPDVFYVGLQDYVPGGTMQAWFGGQYENYAKYGKTTCVDPNGNSGGKSGIYDVGGYYINAVYQVREAPKPTFHSVQDAFEMAHKDTSDPVFIGLQNVQSDGTCQVFMGNDPNSDVAPRYSMYGVPPPGSCTLRPDGFHVGGAHVNACYFKEEMAVQDVKAKLVYILKVGDDTVRSISAKYDLDQGRSNQIMFVLAEEVENITGISSSGLLNYTNFQPVSSMGEILTRTSANAPTRSPILRFQNAASITGDNYHITTFGVEKMAEVFVCPNSTKLHEKIARGRNLIKPHTQAYTILHQFFDKVQEDMIVQSDIGCDFARWLANQFGQVIVAQETYYTKPTTLYEPYTRFRQRALYFTFTYIWSMKHDVFAAGSTMWDTILADYMSPDGEKRYNTTQSQKDLWQKMAIIPGEQDKLPIPDITPPPANEQDVGYLFQTTDMDVDAYNSNWEGFTNTLWSKMSYGFKLTSDEHGVLENYVEGLPNLGDFGSDGNFDNAAYRKKMLVEWNRTLPILNNKAVANPASDDHLEHLAEQVRIARLHIAECLYANFNQSVVLNDITARAPMDSKYYKLDLKHDFIGTVRHMIKVRLSMPKLRDYHIKSYQDLQSIGGETQLFSRMSGDCYKGINERLHLEDPEWNSVFWYQTKFSTDTTSVYYCPSANSSLPKSPCVVIAYRGTSFESDYNSKSGSKFNRLFQMVTDKMGDFYTDMQIMTGEAASTLRMDSAKDHANALMTGPFSNVPYFYLTGHSLGGAIAMHTLEFVVTDRMVKAVVFNPGVGADAHYFAEVDWSLDNAFTKRKANESEKDVMERKAQLEMPIRVKLESQLIRGSASSLLKNDPVSRFAGGLGTTHHYEGVGIPDGLAGHTVRMFPNQDVHGLTSVETPIPTSH